MSFGLDTMDLSNPFGEPCTFQDEFEPPSFNGRPPPTPMGYAGQLAAEQMLPERGYYEGAAPAAMPFQRPMTLNAADYGGPAALARAVMQREMAWSAESQLHSYYDLRADYEDLGPMVELPTSLPAPLPARPSPSRSSTAPRESSMQKCRSLMNFTEPERDTAAFSPSQYGVRRIPATLHGGKTKIFSHVVDTEHTQVIHFEDLINRDKPVRRTSSVRRLGPRPAADFRQNEAWQRAYAAREQAQQRSAPQKQEKPRLNVPRAASARRPPRNQQQFMLMRGSGGVPATLVEPMERSHDRRVAAVLAAEGGFHPGEEVEEACSFRPEAMAPSALRRMPPQQRQPTPTPEPQLRSWAPNDEARPILAPPLPSQGPAASSSGPPAARPSAVPPPLPGSPGLRARALEEPQRSLMQSQAGDASSSEAGCRAAASASSRATPSASSSRLPPTQDHPLREMQRLLGETWRYQQLGAAATGSSGPGSQPSTRPAGLEQGRSPIQFRSAEDGLPRAPPPICSDLVEVCATAGSLGGGDKPPPADSPDYVFLGRLVATLPGEKPATAAQGEGPKQPQAVVECNFWQLREALANAMPSSTHAPDLNAPGLGFGQRPAGTDPTPALAGWQALIGAGGLLEVQAGAGARKADTSPLPPWPHEM